jgi:hypothetical protein
VEIKFHPSLNLFSYKVAISLILQALYVRENNPVKEDNLDGAFCTYGEINAHISVGNLKGRENL